MSARNQSSHPCFKYWIAQWSEHLSMPRRLLKFFLRMILAYEHSSRNCVFYILRHLKRTWIRERGIKMAIFTCRIVFKTSSHCPDRKCLRCVLLEAVLPYSSFHFTTIAATWSSAFDSELVSGSLICCTCRKE